MIRTRFGSEVTVTRVDMDKGVAFDIYRVSDGHRWASLPLCDLRADGGIREIMQHAEQRGGCFSSENAD